MIASGRTSIGSSPTTPPGAMYSVPIALLTCLALSVSPSQERSGVATRPLLLEVPGARIQEPSSGRSARVVYGTTLARGATPVESARVLLERTGASVEAGADFELATAADGRSVLEVGWDRGTQSHRFRALRFRQLHDDVPVFRAGAGFLVRAEPGNPVVLAAFDVKELPRLDTSAARDPRTGEPSAAMLEATRRFFDGQLVARGFPVRTRRVPVRTSEEELVVFAGTPGVPAEPALALKFVATRGSITTNAALFQRHLVLASVETGEILYTEDGVQGLVDVVGSVSGYATQGLESLECGPLALVPLPYAEVGIQGGFFAFADANGQFVISNGGAATVNVDSGIGGLYFNVIDVSGGATLEITSSVTPPGPIDFVHNVSGSDLTTAAVNAYVEANRVRDYVLQYAPGFPSIGSQQGFLLIVNEDRGFAPCNAWYTGTGIVFSRADGGCHNTAFSDVVYHEYAHRLIEVTGNGGGQFGQGAADTMGVLIQDDPVLGQGFETCGVGIRTADNTLQYPCSGSAHTCGQLLSGCVWSLRNELVVTEPAAYRDIGASLFLDMLVARGVMVPGDPGIDPLVTVLYLVLDDDDADIGNGTPHYAEIASAFGSHGMDAPPLELIDFVYPDGRPELIDPHGGAFPFTFEVTGVTDSPIPGTGVLHLDRGSGLESFPLPQLAPNVYAVTFPALPCGRPVGYYFSAQASSGPVSNDPPGAPADPFRILATDSVVTAFVDDFESDLGWTVSGTAVEGVWERGMPEGDGTGGDPLVDADGSGSCYLTGNAPGNSDVDLGATVLLSPPLDAMTSAGCEALVAYSRWFSNDRGSVTDDVFLVEISADGDGNWVTLETVGPTGPESSGGWFEKIFRVSDHVSPTNYLQLRFTASDEGVGSVVEAGVDYVRILQAECDPPTRPDEASPTPTGSVEVDWECLENPDSPDSAFEDSNCDGIDGDRRRAVFVATSGSPGNPGTMLLPLDDVNAAILLAASLPGKDHVYVSEGVYAGRVDLVEGVSVWGGFSAANGWDRSDVYQTTFSVGGEYGNGRVGVLGVGLTSPSTLGGVVVAPDPGGPESHSYGILLQSCDDVTLEDVTVTGAAGGPGSDGASGTPGADGGVGSNGVNGLGGVGAFYGGDGGTGGNPDGESGAPGGGPAGGAGGSAGASTTDGGDGGVGGDGVPGAAGDAATNVGSVLGGLWLADGDGAAGTPGEGGSGGGGGGGGGSFGFTDGGMGGGGGGGGFPGSPGDGGGAGGSSFALFLNASSVHLFGCVLAAGSGGDGGTGGSGGPGGLGGAGGNGANGSILGAQDGGNGGPGGIGGAGGPGAGGGGGHSYAILADTASFFELVETRLFVSTPGVGGPGGPGAPSGAGGEALEVKLP